MCTRSVGVYNIGTMIRDRRKLSSGCNSSVCNVNIIVNLLLSEINRKSYTRMKCPVTIRFSL